MFARTARLTLRPAWPEDAAAVAALGHREVACMLSRAPFACAEADGYRPEASWLILSHEGDYPAIVGGIGLGRSALGPDRQLGYWLAPHARGRGYATEAGRAVLDTARRTLGLDRLTATCRHDGTAAARVLARLGFRRTGDAEIPCRAEGDRLLPCATYALDLSDRLALAEAA